MNYYNQPYPNNQMNFQQRPAMMPVNNGITWVQGIEGAKAFMMQPNSNAVLMDSENDGVFYIKVCDGAGMYNLRTFNYAEVQNTDSRYVTREEFNALLNKLGGNDNGKSTVSATKRKSTTTADELE